MRYDPRQDAIAVYRLWRQRNGGERQVDPQTSGQ